MCKPKLYLVVAVLGLVALIASACTPGVLVPTNTTRGANFRLLVSDEANDIGDFAHLNVTISSIGIQPASDNTSWLQFSPRIATVDLTTLLGEKALEIWSGNVTPGRYSKVFIYVSDVEGILSVASDNGTVNVKLPSGKLQISKPFTVSANSPTSFIFDITVVKAGQSGQYILKPQIGESGADRGFSEVEEREREREKEPEHGRLKLRIEGDARPGAQVVLVVMEPGQPAEGAAVTVNGQEIGATNSQGKVNITISPSIKEVEVKATLGEMSGKLKLKFEKEAPETELKGTIKEINGHIWKVTTNGEIRTVDTQNARIEGSPQVGSRVEVKGVNNAGIVVASEIDVKAQGKGKAEEREKEREGDEESESEDESEQESPPTIPHTLQGRESCLACHGANGIEPFPSDHAGRTNDVCTACHQPSQ